MDNTTILFIWDVPERLRDYLETGLKGLKQLQFIYPDEVSEQSLLNLASNADIVVGWRPTFEFLETAKGMKLFINPGVGVQHHIQPFRKLNEKREVVLVNGHGNTYFTAQHAVALLLALMNKVIPHHNWMVEGQWRKGDKDAKSTPLRDRTIGLLGYGAINTKVHRFLSGFNVQFSILRRSWKNQDQELPTNANRYEPPELHQFLEEVDILIVAVPLTDDTINMLGFEEIKLLGKDGLLVNVGRGKVINEESLYRALAEGLIAGAAIDVWYVYKPEPDENGLKYPFDYPFHKLGNVVLSPHRAMSPFDDLKRWDEVIENIRRFAEGRRDLLNIVNLERGY